MVGGNLRRCSGGVAAIGAYAHPCRRGAALDMFRPWTVKGSIVRRTKTCGLLWLPVRLERPRDVFKPSVLKVRWVPGVASYRTPCQQTVFLRRHPIDLKTWNATPLQPVW